MDFNIVAIIAVLVVAFLAGMESILDQFQFHQPIIACSLIGLATGHLSCLLYTSPSPRDVEESRMPSSA